MSYAQHRKSSAGKVVRCAVITLSDTRTTETDTSGKKIIELLGHCGHIPADYRILKDEPEPFQQCLIQLLDHADIDAILTTGGTGVGLRDRTVDVVEKLLDRHLPGFGELFRLLSYEQIGSGAMLSRAIAGIARNKLIFAMPGSTAAVELAMSKLILPEIGHLVAVKS